MIVNTPTKSVITIATGKPYYIHLAVNLARSFLYHHPHSDIKFWMVTDGKQHIPDDVLQKIKVLEIKPGEYGKGFSTKLYLDQFAQTQQTLFIDADCLVYGDLGFVFDRFEGRAISAIGDNINEGEFFCDVNQVVTKLGLNYMPRFVGGVYYLEKGETSTQVFSKARDLLSQYDDIGLIRLRGVENEEPLVALAMSASGEKAIPEDGSIKADRMFFHMIDTNILSGKARLWNKGKNENQRYYPIASSNPVIVHFNASFAEGFEYQSEVIRLILSFRYNIPHVLANMVAFGTTTLPGLLKSNVKNVLRPLYHFLFGHRKIKSSKRLSSL